MGTFFGLTKLGEPNLFASSSRRCEYERQKRKAIAGIPIDSFVDAFEARASQNVSHTLRRVLLPQIFEQVLDRDVDPHEMELLLRYFDLSGGHMDLNEFELGLQRLLGNEDPAIQRGERPKSPGEDHARFGRYSNFQLREMRRRDTRNDFGPMDVLKYPLTGNQKYGWQVDTKLRSKKDFHPHSSTDVTRTEGICLASYYLV